MATDPVCAMAVDLAEGPHVVEAGRTWRFCSVHCRDEFVLDPARFVGPTQRADRS